MSVKILSFVLTNRAFQSLVVKGLEILAKRTDNTIDDQLVQVVKVKLRLED